MSDKLFTEEDIRLARGMDLINLTESFGYTPVKRGGSHVLKEAQHIVIRDGNRYYDNYRQKWGDAITFLQDFADMRFIEAIPFLLECQGYAEALPPEERPAQRRPAEEEKAPFVLPEANEDNRRVFAYLRKRGVAAQVIAGLINAGLLYEDKQYHNCVFVGKRPDGVPAFAFKRGTYDKDSAGFKGDVPGSDKSIAFRLPCNPADDTLSVFESPIDLASYMTLHRDMAGNAVALCCLHDGAMETYLRENPHIKNIVLCLDADEWAKKAIARIREKYTAEGYAVTVDAPPRGKDWNEYLQYKKSNRKKKEQEIC